ncbi:twin-arginine translocase TatA/TatE family subunit [Sphingomonas sinipercae]|uniref:Sec-independent protein translocase protein TatA n=1 Tax=Sphingomonas sinipercae TaxID=2714944 RepID=A0A6G7ZQ56_9SPHN|nr:twin-arginine translocase TatA/TatE family subunit [Sphingomonas sinipercae]QIL03059.1 twin-arginine translocase TatA/TatE family subunit [Sphingomonas sinipercae]
MGGFSLIHWIILGLFLLLLFGGNRFSAAMKDVGKGLRSFKEGIGDEEEERRKRVEAEGRLQSRPPERPIEVTPEPRPTAEQPPLRDDEPRR